MTARVCEMLDPSSVQHLTAGFSEPTLTPQIHASLPYGQLGSAGLERLCYSIVLARGDVPRYFGNPGQAQHGIDLLAFEGTECTVYQCKNVASFTRQSMGNALRHFENEWLGSAALPKPTKFVLCCPLPLRERKTNEEWTILESEFFDRTGVRVEAWDKEFLDAQLRNLPDVVADLFSDLAAERFCNLDDWNEDLFRPVRFGSAEPSVNRYLEKKTAGQIFIDPRMSEQFTLKLESYGSLLILGLPGSGKTITGLVLAESFRGGLYRVFFVNMRRDLSEDALVKGIRRRLARPTIFLIDDCHGKYEILEGVQDRIRQIVAHQTGRAFLVYTARTTPTPEGMPRADYSGFVEEFKRAKSALDFRPTPELFASIAAVVKPDLRELSKERLERVFTATGRDLFLLDQLLDTIKSPNEIDQLKPEQLFEETLQRYFGQPTVHRPGFMLLTAIAQFEVAPTVADFPYDLRKEDAKAAAQLLVEADRPPRYFFLHSSAAELVFRALAWNERVDHVEANALKLIQYFGSRSPTDSQLPSDFSSVLRNRLKLRHDEAEEHLLKSRMLADDTICAFVDAAFEDLSLNTVALILNILKSADEAVLDRYRKLVQRKIDAGTVLKVLISNFSSLFLTLIKNEYPAWYSSLKQQFADHGLPQVVRTSQIQNLLKLLAAFAREQDFILASAMDSVSEDEFDRLMQRTVASGRSIANIGWEIRELKKIDLPLLEQLERKIGSQRYLHLIASAGTLSELFKLIESSSTSMTRELIEALDEETVDTLVRKTITAGRSIATLHLTLRELKETDIDLLQVLEQKLGARRSLSLITTAGTVFELFRAIQYSSTFLAGELIDLLDDETLETLIQKTIVSGRSIGTLDYTLRELNRSEPALLEKLEQKVGARRYLRLIASAGTIFEIFRLIQRSSRTMAAELIGALDESIVTHLIEKTIASDRSIGTLSFTLRELKLSAPAELDRLERQIGVDGWWRLILANGKINVLAPLLKYMDDSFRLEMVRASRRLTIEDWEGLLLRGDFSDLTVFVRIGERSPKLFTPGLISGLRPTFKKLIQSADWAALNVSAQRLSASLDSDLKEHLEALLNERVAETDIAMLSFKAFQEGAASISTLWRAAPSKRNELVTYFFNILPREDSWYRKPSFVRAACGPLYILASAKSPENIDQRMLDMCNNQDVAALLPKAESLDIFLFLWNLYCLWFKHERIVKRESESKFFGFLNSEIQTNVDRVLRQRLRSSRDGSEKKHLVTLLGFLQAAGINKIRDDDRKDWLSELPLFDELILEVEATQSFVFASFFLIGLAWIFNTVKDIPRSTASIVISRASLYTERTAALENLRRLLSLRFENLPSQPTTEKSS